MKEDKEEPLFSEQQINEGNNLISEFLLVCRKKRHEWVFREPNGKALFLSDWNWLMPVIHEIECEGYRFTISSVHVCVYTCKNGSSDGRDSYNVTGLEGKLNCTWYAVVEFIKWYKSNNFQHEKHGDN